MINATTFRDLMGGVCSPVAIVTTLSTDNEPSGCTVSSLISLSLDPPLVGFALGRGSRLLSALEPGARVGVHILGADQGDLATHFAQRSAGTGSKFDGMTWSVRDGAPCLPGSAGWAAGSIARHVDAGDHVLMIVTVDEAETTRIPPLVYARRTFGTHSGLMLAG